MPIRERVLGASVETMPKKERRYGKRTSALCPLQLASRKTVQVDVKMHGLRPMTAWHNKPDLLQTLKITRYEVPSKSSLFPPKLVSRCTSLPLPAPRILKILGPGDVVYGPLDLVQDRGALILDDAVSSVYKLYRSIYVL